MTTLLGPNGLPIRKAEVSVPTQSIGVGSVIVWGNTVQSFEQDPRLQGDRKYQTFQNLLVNVSIIAAGVRYYANLVAKANWKFEPADDSAEAQELAELTEEIVNDMNTPWRRVVRRASLYKMYGFSVQEWTAKRRDDGKNGLMDIEVRPCNTVTGWKVDRSGTVQEIIQTSPQDNTEIRLPRDKCLYLVEDTLTDHPEGIGLLRHLSERADRLKRYEELEGFGFETDLRGIPVGRAPIKDLRAQAERAMGAQPGSGGQAADVAIAQSVNALQQFLRNHIKRPDTSLLLDSEVYRNQGPEATPSNVSKWGIDLIKADSSSAPELANAIERLTRDMARILGVEGLLLGNGQGSQALSRDKSHSFGLNVESAIGEIAEGVRRDICIPIALMNGYDRRLIPKPKPDAIQYRDVEQITAALADMAQAGAVLAPDDPAIDEVRSLLGLSRQPEVQVVSIEEHEAALAAERDASAALNSGNDDNDETRPGQGGGGGGKKPAKGDQKVKETK